MRFEIDQVMQRLLDEAYRLLAALPLLLLAVLVIWLGWVVGRWLSRRALLDRVSRKNPFLSDLARTTTRWISVGIAILVALEILDATALVGAVLGTAGVMGVALGFAFKDTLENYLAGLLMSLRQPFAPRDHVVIDGNEGTVVALTSRATILMTPDGNHLRLPNALVFRSVTLNYTRNPSRRLTFDVGIGVNEDLVCAQQLGVDTLLSLEGVMESPPPRAYITELADSSVKVRYHAWVDQGRNDFLSVKSEAIRCVKLALEAAGMDMPEPTYRLQITERMGLPPSSVPKAEAEPIGPTATAAPDTRAHDDLEQQIDADQRSRPTQDLLDSEAPRE